MQLVKNDYHANTGSIYMSAKFAKASRESNENILSGKWNFYKTKLGAF